VEENLDSWSREILDLPSSLFLIMTAPLNLIESNRLLPNDAILLTQNLHWMLWIAQVGIERHAIGGQLQTFLLLRYMEYVVHTRQACSSSKRYATTPSLAKTGNRLM
jgi:hypothetical protein